MVKKKKRNGVYYFFKVLWFILKIPYYIFKGIYTVAKLIKEALNKETVEKKKRVTSSDFKDFKVIKETKGDYKKWIEGVFESDSQIGIILGSRGSGKTAFGVRLLENIYSKTKKNCYALGFKDSEMPSWIKVIEEISEIENDSLVLIDEGGILFSSRRSMSNANKILSELIMISRHKNLSILFISQNSSNIEVNVLRQADFLVLKKFSLLQKDFERKIVQKIYDEAKGGFKELKNNPGLTYIYSDAFKGFVSNTLPSFWEENLSKAFK